MNFTAQKAKLIDILLCFAMADPSQDFASMQRCLCFFLQLSIEATMKDSNRFCLSNDASQKFLLKVGIITEKLDS